MAELVGGFEEVVEEDYCASGFEAGWGSALDVVEADYTVGGVDVCYEVFVVDCAGHSDGEVTCESLVPLKVVYCCLIQ